MGAWTGFVWLRIGTDGGNFVNGVMNFKFHIMRRNINKLGTC